MGQRSAIRITARTVAAAKPGTMLWDAELRGFGLRTSCAGTRTFVLKYRAGARQRWFTIGVFGSPWSAEMARNRAKELLGATVGGADPAKERDTARRVPMVAELAQRFLTEHVAIKAKPRTAFEYRRLLERFIIPALGHMRTTDVAAADIARLHHALRATPRQANITINVARKMFRLAEAWGIRQPGSNPCVHIERYHETHRERFLSHQEIARLGEALTHCEVGWTTDSARSWCRHMHAVAQDEGRTDAAAFAAGSSPRRMAPEHPSAVAALRLLMLTGARLSEALSLTWDMVDWEERVLRLPDSKTGAKVIPLAPAAVQVIERQLTRRETGNPFVFPGGVPGKALVNLEDPWQRIRAIAGLPDVRIHDLRHTLASHAAMGGMSLPLIGRVLGHRSSATTARYAHFAADPVRQAAEAMAKHVADLLTPTDHGGAEIRLLRPGSSRG
jgi:integrase